MRVKIFFLIIVLLVCSAATINPGDWKTKINNYFQKVNDYDGAITFLSSVYKDQNEIDKKFISAILSYSCNKKGRKSGEIYYYEEFLSFEDPEEQLSFTFLSADNGLAINNYLNSMLSNYPIVKNIKLHSNEYQYNKRINRIDLNVYAVNAASYKLLDNKNEIIKSGFLSKGINTINLSSSDPMVILGTHKIKFSVSIGEYVSTKHLVLNISLEKPADLEFENNVFHYKGRSLKSETIDKSVVETRKYFDKKFFLVKSLPLIGGGTVLYLGNQAILKSPLDDNEFTLKNGPIYSGSNKALNIITIGIIAKGLFNFGKSFKTERKTKIIKVPDQAGIEYNKLLRKAMESAIDSVIIKFNLKVERI